MIEWEEEMVIHQKIDKIWSLFSDDNIQRIMPQVVKHELLEKTEREVGAKHKQSYKEGKRTMTYIVETLAYEDSEDRKQKQIYFVMGKSFEIDLYFTLIRIDENQTRFIYSGCSQGRNWIGKTMMKFISGKGNMKNIKDFMARVEEEALRD